MPYEFVSRLDSVSQALSTVFIVDDFDMRGRKFVSCSKLYTTCH